MAEPIRSSTLIGVTTPGLPDQLVEVEVEAIAALVGDPAEWLVVSNLARAVRVEGAHRCWTVGFATRRVFP